VSKKETLLLALDDTEASTQAVKYVGRTIGGNSAFTIHLLHVLAPLPPRLSETRGSENPKIERKLEEDLMRKRERWIKDAEKEAQPIFDRAKLFLRKAGIPSSAIETEFWVSVNRQDLINDILDAASTNGCRTIVVGRESFAWLKRILRRHVADELVRKAKGFTVWVVE
jgi:nucleotide-binding universal stress UspA family protein